MKGLRVAGLALALVAPAAPSYAVEYINLI